MVSQAAYTRPQSFFFFQAEDGIRDWSVTGVQTCALPISGSGSEHVNCSNFEDTNVVLLPHCVFPCESRRSDLLAIGGGGDNSCSSCCSWASTEPPMGCGPCSDTVTETPSPVSTWWDSQSNCSVALKSRL